MKDRERLSELQEFGLTNDEEWELNEQRVNDAWFLWIVVNYYHSKYKLVETDMKCEYSYSGRHLNSKELCRVVWEDICSPDNKWVTHTCKTPACSEGYVTVDGNEHLKRSKRALPMDRSTQRPFLTNLFIQCCNH